MIDTYGALIFSLAAFYMTNALFENKYDCMVFKWGLGKKEAQCSFRLMKIDDEERLSNTVMAFYSCQVQSNNGPFSGIMCTTAGKIFVNTYTSKKIWNSQVLWNCFIYLSPPFFQAEPALLLLRCFSLPRYTLKTKAWDENTGNMTWQFSNCIRVVRFTDNSRDDEPTEENPCTRHSQSSATLRSAVTASKWAWIALDEQ